VEEDRIALRVEPLKLAVLANMRTADPCPLSCFLKGVVPYCPEDLSVDLKKGGDEVILKVPVCHVLARFHELGQASPGQGLPVAIMTETFAEENHDGAGGHVIIKQAFKR
jgi:hypothetical protein